MSMFPTTHLRATKGGIHYQLFTLHPSHTKIGSHLGVNGSTLARKVRGPWFDSRSWPGTQLAFRAECFT